MQFIYDLINSMMPLSEKIRGFLNNRLEEEKIKRGEIILQAGKVARKIYFIQSGLIMSYYKRGFLKLACGFWKENEVAFSVESFFSLKPAVEYMMALEDSIVYTLYIEDVRELCQSYPSFHSCIYELVRRSHKINVDSLHGFIVLRGMQRFNHFAETYPELIDRVPQKYIATYIGVSAETICVYKRQQHLLKANKNS